MDEKTKPSADEVKALRKKKKLDLEAKHPKRKIGCLLVHGEEFWVTSPSRQQWHAFKSAVTDKTRTLAARENLTTQNCVDPAGADVGKRIDEGEPALAETLATYIAELGGMDDEAEKVDFRDA